MGDELNAFLGGVNWPRFADGTPVMVGDRAMDDTGYTWTVDGVGFESDGRAALFDGGELLHFYKRGEAVRRG